MHLTIYAMRPDIRSVVHAHPPVATGFATAGKPLNLALLPHHSFVVAALASTVAYTISCGLILVLFARQAGVKFRPLMIVERRDLSLILAMWQRRLARAG